MSGMNSGARRAALILGVLTGFVCLAGPPDYEISRSSVDDGGAMRSSGGEFELSGTIGQPAAGALTGGEFELAGGFWFGLPPTDCNDDGLLNLLDYETFTACFLGPNEGIDANPCPCFDIDRSIHQEPSPMDAGMAKA